MDFYRLGEEEQEKLISEGYTPEPVEFRNTANEYETIKLEYEEINKYGFLQTLSKSDFTNEFNFELLDSIDYSNRTNMLKDHPSFSPNVKDDLDFLGETKIKKYPEGYDPIYVKIYDEEKTYVNLKGYDKLVKLGHFRSNFMTMIKHFKTKIHKYGIYSQNSITPKTPVTNPIPVTQICKDKLEFILKYLHTYLNDIVIAGGSVVNLLLNIDDEHSDFDIFFICSYERAKQIIRNVHNELEDVNRNAFKVIDGENFIQFTFKWDKIKIQFIKRIYESPSQIVHGFDIDCCCCLIKFDKNFNPDKRYKYEIYGTQRCLYAFSNMVNTINFDRLSLHIREEYINSSFEKILE